MVVDREQALAGLDQARDRFRAAFDAAPDAALGFLKEGDDYSLGGLVPHIAWVFTHYGRVLDGMVASRFGECRASDPPEELAAVATATRAGMASHDERESAIREMEAGHEAVTQQVRALPGEDFERKAQVFYGDAAEPYPTSAADVVGWLTEHYEEHVPHSAQLLEDYLKAVSVLSITEYRDVKEAEEKIRAEFGRRVAQLEAQLAEVLRRQASSGS